MTLNPATARQSADQPDIVGDLTSLGGSDASDGAEKRLGRLVAASREADILDVVYRRLDSPVGSLLLLATPRGIVRVAFEGEGHDAVLADTAGTFSPRMLHDPSAFDAASHQLDEYFAGSRLRFDVGLDLALAKGFRRDVLDQLALVPYGTTVSYGELAASAGRPAAVRAAASACSHNPLPLLLPCHRVVRASGAVGEYLGGTAAKRFLLDLERRRT